MKKKITIICCIILLLFNFIFKASYAAETTAPTTGTGVPTPTTQTAQTTQATSTSTSPEVTSVPSLNKMIEGSGLETVTGTLKDLKNGSTAIQGSDTTTTKKVSFKDKLSDSPTYNVTIMSVVVFIVEVINNIPELIVEASGTTDIDKFTIYDLVMGHYDFFNADFSNLKFVENAQENSLLKNVYTSVFKYYRILRNLSFGIAVFVLLYIAIRMALSTLSDRRARYKNMLIGWITSMFILAFMHFIIVAIPYVTQKILDILEIFAEKMDISRVEYDILSGQRSTLKEGGWNIHVVQALLICSIFVYYELKFIIGYLKRFCEIVFLITVSPLVTVTYSIDKVGDGKAQAFNAWFKQLLHKYMVQVVHAFTYIVFFAAAGAIAETFPILAIAFLLAMERAEKMFRNMLGVNDENFAKAKVPVLDRHKKK